MIDVISFPVAGVAMLVVPSRWLAAFARRVNPSDSEAISGLKRLEARGIDLSSWLPPIFNRPKRQGLSDKVALDAITLAMSGQEWDSDTTDVIAEIVRRTGRVIEDFPPYDAKEMCAGDGSMDR